MPGDVITSIIVDDFMTSETYPEVYDSLGLTEFVAQSGSNTSTTTTVNANSAFWSAAGAPGYGRVYYFNATSASDIGGYNIAMATPSPNAQSTIPIVNTGTSWTSAGLFLTQPAEPYTTSLPAGNADRNIWMSVDNGVAKIRLDLYIRTVGGTLTLVRSSTSEDISSTVPYQSFFSIVDPNSYAMSLTDRLLFKLSTKRVSGPANVTTTLYFEGENYASHAHTTILDSSPALGALSLVGTPSAAGQMLVSTAVGTWGYPPNVVPPGATGSGNYRSKFGIINSEDFFYQAGLSAVPDMNAYKSLSVGVLGGDLTVRCPTNGKTGDEFFLTIYSNESSTTRNITWENSSGFSGDNSYWLTTSPQMPFPATIAPAQILYIRVMSLFGVWRLLSVTGAPSKQVLSMASNYTTVAADVERTIYLPVGSSNGYTWTIASNSSVPYPIGTTIQFINDATSTIVTLSAKDATFAWTGFPTTSATRNLSGIGSAVATKVTTSRWVLDGTNIL